MTFNPGDTPTRQQIAETLAEADDAHIAIWGSPGPAESYLDAADAVLALFGPSEAERAAWQAGFNHGRAAAERVRERLEDPEAHPLIAPADPEPVRPEWVRIVRRRTPYTFPKVGDVVYVDRWLHDPLSGLDRAMVANASGRGHYALNRDEWEPADPPVPETPPTSSDQPVFKPGGVVPGPSPTVMVELTRSDASLYAANIANKLTTEGGLRLAAACRKALEGTNDG